MFTLSLSCEIGSASLFLANKYFLVMSIFTIILVVCGFVLVALSLIIRSVLSKCVNQSSPDSEANSGFIYDKPDGLARPVLPKVFVIGNGQSNNVKNHLTLTRPVLPREAEIGKRKLNDMNPT